MADNKQIPEDDAHAAAADGATLSDRVVSLGSSESESTSSSGKKRKRQKKGAAQEIEPGASTESSSSFIRLDAPSSSSEVVSGGASASAPARALNAASGDSAEELVSYGTGRLSQMLADTNRSIAQLSLSSGANDHVVRTLDEAKNRDHQFWGTQPVPKLGTYVT